MAVINGTVVGAEAGFYPKEIEQSLRFNDDDSAYLSWTPASAGNRKTWTFSTWVKRGNLGSFTSLFSDRSDDNNKFFASFDSSDRLDILANTGSGTIVYRLTTNAVYRDTSAWYHIVIVADTTQATATNRAKLYVNGVQVTSLANATYPSQNTDLNINNATTMAIGRQQQSTPTGYLDSYLAETHFIDGTALDASSFGEFKNGVWIPKDFSGSYGTNGFYLPYNNDYTVEGFSATTYQGNGSTSNYIGGVGFEPDLIWVKKRSTGTARSHRLIDSIRGDFYLASDTTGGESAMDFDIQSDGFLIKETSDAVNGSGAPYVAWCWDAGTGSPVSNTDGTITSTVKANTERGFSIVSYTAGASYSTVGHGLSQAPDMIITKSRTTGTYGWPVYHSALGNTKNINLNLTDAASTVSNYWGTPNSATFGLSTNGDWNNSGNMIAYCFHSVAGYSDFGSYTGTGAAGNTVTTGFKPAFVMVKRATGGTGGWYIWDGVRSPTDPRDDVVQVNTSDAETVDSATYDIDFTDTGFVINNTSNNQNASGSTYIYMAFADTREAAFWLDQSGNNNDWENNGLTESDISLDSPTNNFATLNPLDLRNSDSSTVLSEGNLKFSGVGARRRPTFAVSSGKWYAEFVFTSITSDGRNILVYSNGNDEYYAYQTNGLKNLSGTTSAYGATWTANDVISAAIDVDGNTIEFFKNGVSQGVISSLNFSDTMQVWSSGVGVLRADTGFANFGQDSSFAGSKVAQGNTDANGRGDFYYAPPAGYLALCTANLPEPAIGPNSATTADEHFNTVTYIGNGTGQSITGVNHQPDLIWFKDRTSAFSHEIRDAVRGKNMTLASNTTGAELDRSGLTSFDTDGFTLDVRDGMNKLNDAYVAWNWKANGSGVSNTDGSITSTVSANVDAGFSIVSYTGTGATTDQTVGHGLSGHAMTIIKARGSAASGTWQC